MEEKYYSTKDLEKLGIPLSSINRWSLALRGTSMVKKLEDGKVYFSEAFLNFIRKRMQRQGPASLPEPERIADLYRLFAQYGGAEAGIAKIAQELESIPLIIEVQLKQLELI